MEWSDIASIVFVCVTANHLGLIGKIEGAMGFRIPIANCPKCASFWFTLAYLVGKMGFSISHQIPLVLAVSFLASYSALWLELMEGLLDTLYVKFYETIYSGTEDDAVAADASDGDSEGSVSEL